jgi:hypothetical protein
MKQHEKCATYIIKKSTVTENKLAISNEVIHAVVVFKMYWLKFSFDRGEIHWPMNDFVVVRNLNIVK